MVKKLRGLLRSWRGKVGAVTVLLTLVIKAIDWVGRFDVLKELAQLWPWRLPELALFLVSTAGQMCIFGVGVVLVLWALVGTPVFDPGAQERGGAPSSRRRVSDDEREQAAQLAYTGIVETAIESCRLKTWKGWTSGPLGVFPWWPKDVPDLIEEFACRVLGAVLPGRYPDLERAITTLAHSLHDAAQYFMRHAEPDERRGGWIADRFYRQHGSWDADEDARLREEWDGWIGECYETVVIATKAANWFAEEVRRHLNPWFLLTEGKFLVTRPGANMSFTTVLYEFTPTEKTEMPASLLARIERRDS